MFECSKLTSAVIDAYADVRTLAFKHQQPIFNQALPTYWYDYTLPKGSLIYSVRKSSPNKSVVKNSDCEAMSKVKLEWILSLGFSTNLDILVDVQTERKTDKQKERRTNRRKDGQTERKTYKQKERQTNRRKDRQTEGKTDKQKERRTYKDKSNVR